MVGSQPTATGNGKAWLEDQASNHGMMDTTKGKARGTGTATRAGVKAIGIMVMMTALAQP